MTTTAIVDLVCAVFTSILYARHFADRGISRSNRLLNLNLVFLLATLLIDASAYIFVGPAYPLPFRFFINFLAFNVSCFNVIVFTFYTEALFSEKTKINLWLFRILKTVEFLWLFGTAYEFIAGHLLTYDVNGIENLDYAFPTYIVILNMVIHLFLLLITVIYSRRIGKKMALLLALFECTPIISSLLYTFAGLDFAYALGAVMLGLVAEFVQKKQTQELRQKDKVIQELANQQRYIKSFGAMVNAALWTIRLNDRDEIINVYWSNEVRRMLGYEETPEAFPDAIGSWVEIIHPEDKKRVLDNFYNSVKSRDTSNFVYDIEFRGQRKSGEYRWYHSVGRMEYTEDGNRQFFGITFDISAERKLKEQQALSDGLAREYHTVWLMDSFGEHNLHLYRSTGKTTLQSAVQLGLDQPCFDTAVVKYIRDNILEEDQERVIEETRFETIVRETPETGTYVVTYRRYTNDRTDFTYHQMCFARATDTDGTVNYILAYRDADKMMREQIAQQEQLEEALSMADAANKAKTDFLFNMSHDIRTPMNAIIGFTNIAKKEIHDPEKALDSLEKVQLSSSILLNLINDVLDMSRIESGKAELHEEKYEIFEAFDTFQPAMASLAASKDIDLSFRIGEVRNRFIFADGPRFDRVLINIISNAIKYTPPEGFVKVTADQVADTKPGYGNYRFTVSDSGIGMSEEFQKHMFEDFTREENSTTSGVQGTGLGLSLAKRLVDMMGGTISCISTQGLGTTFTIVFPFRLQTEEDIANQSVAVTEEVTVDLNGKKALLVEDNELNREIAEEMLTDEGIVVETAADGQKAVNKVRERGADYYDFILMDIQMPVMNGFEATKAIHELMPDFKSPIIALSANAFAEDKQKSLEAGMDDHVAKPINIHELIATLARF